MNTNNSFHPLGKSLHAKVVAFEKMKQTAPKYIGNMAVNFFRSSFEKGGFTDKGFVPWKARATPDKNKQRAILVKTGHLRAAVGSSLKSATFENISFLISLPYAEIQNYGGTIKMPERSAILHFKFKGKNHGEGAQIRFSKVNKAHFAQKVHVGAHEINIPPRKFIGNSATLLGMIDDYMKKQLSGIK